MTSTPRILVLGTGGTIAGAGAGGTGAAYRPGGLSLDVLVGHLAALGLAAEWRMQEIARIGSQDIGFAEWRALHAACTAVRTGCQQSYPHVGPQVGLLKNQALERRC